MAHKAIGTRLWFEVPNHETGVHGPSSKLLHVGAEGYTCHCVSVPLEMALQTGVFLREGVPIKAHHNNIKVWLTHSKRHSWKEEEEEEMLCPECVLYHSTATATQYTCSTQYNGFPALRLGFKVHVELESNFRGDWFQ